MLLLEDGGGLLRVYSYILSSFYLDLSPPQMDTFTGLSGLRITSQKGGEIFG